VIFLSVSGCEPKVDLGVASKPEVAAPLDAKSPDETVTAPAVEKPASSEIKISDEAFRFAAHDGRIETVRSSIQSGKEVNAKDPTTSHTAMHMAAYNGHSDIVKLLLEHDAAVDPRDAEGKTPLIHACTGPFPETVEILLAAGADINAAEATEGFTPLMMAAGLGQSEVVKVLLSHGADITIEDQDKDTALNHAKNSGHAEIVALLEKLLEK
jgi:ankyrin repeat protein